MDTQERAKKKAELIEQAHAAAAPATGMCDVVAQINGVRDNGHVYQAGDAFHMHRDLIPEHVLAGQVQLANSALRSASQSTRQQGTPRDKQVTGSDNK